MEVKVRRTTFPAELYDAVARYAAAVVAADSRGVVEFVSERASIDHRTAMAHIAHLRPLERFSVIARARLGSQFIVKLRFNGAAGQTALQNRWSEQGDGAWRIVEVEDLAVRSPWKKPDQSEVMKDDA